MQLYEKYSNSSEGKEYESKKLKWPEHLPKLFNGSGLQDCEFLILHCYQDCLKMKKSWKKRVSGCNSVAVKTMKIRINLLYWKLKAFTPTPHISYIWEWIIVAHTTAVSQNGIRHVHFFFYFKIFVQSTFIYIMNLLKPYLFQSSKWHWGFNWA